MIDPYDLVEQNFPYDRPHSAVTVTTAATTLAELVRYLNNATTTWRDSADVLRDDVG